MNSFLKKNGYLIIFVCLLGVVSLVQHLVTRPQDKGDEVCYVSARFTIDKDVDIQSMKAITKVYLSNATNSSEVVSIFESGSDGEYIIDIKDYGDVSSDSFICAGQHITLGQRVKLGGIIGVEGVVTNLKDEKNN